MQYRNIDKQALKNNGYTVLAKISIVGTDTVFTEDDYIVDWDYEDYRYVPNTGFIGQFVERLLDGNLQNISDGVILEDTEINLQLGIVNALDNNTTTWYDYGNFLITKVEKTDTTGNYKFESADYTKKFNKIPDWYMIGFPCTAMELAYRICNSAGVEIDSNGMCYTYVINTNGLTSGNYKFKIGSTYYNFTLDENLEQNDVIYFITSTNKLILRRNIFHQGREYSYYEVRRDELSFTTSSSAGSNRQIYLIPIPYVDFTNNDFVIENNQYNSDDTCRKVMQDIGKLAYSWVRIGEDNKVHIDFTPKQTSNIDTYDQLTTDEYYVSKKSDLPFGPVNKVLIGMSDVDGENTYKTSDDYSDENECAIKIWDNNLTYNYRLREIALFGCEKLFGLQYTPIEINTVGHPWLDGDELIKLTNVDDEIVYTYPFNRKIHYAGYIEGVIGAEASTTQNTKYEYKSDTISMIKKTAFELDRENQRITALAENVDENTSNISQMQIDLDGIDLRVQSVETTEVTAVTNEYAVNNSDTNPPAQSSSDWSETKPTRGEGQYIWARIKTTYKNGNVEYSDPVNTTGDKGDTGGIGPQGPKGDTGSDGDDGKGIVSVTELYYVSNSSAIPAKPTSHVTTSSLVTYNQWNLQCPPYTTTYKYFYTCSEIEYDTDPVTYGWTNVTQNQGLAIANQNAYSATTTATSASTTANNALNNINNLQIGGRNYYLESDTFTTAGSGAEGITPSIENGQWKIVVAASNSNWHRWSHANVIEDNFKNGDKFTFSFEIKSANANITTPPKIYFKSGMGYYTMTGSVSSNWSKVYYTGTWNDTNSISTHLGWGGLSGTYYIRRLKFEAGDKATDWTVAPEDIDADINDAITEIGNQLSNYVTKITYDADWQNRKDEIYSYVNVNYTTTTDFGTYQETMQTALSQKADATTISATATQVVNDAISGIQSTISDINETFTFDTNGLTIARGGNTMYLQLQNDRLAFRTDDTDAGERAYMTSNAFVLKELTQFQIGNFKFEVRTNGSLDFKKV